MSEEGYQSILNLFRERTGATDKEMIRYNQDIIWYTNEQGCSLFAAACVILTEIEEQKGTLQHE